MNKYFHFWFQMNIEYWHHSFFKNYIPSCNSLCTCPCNAVKHNAVQCFYGCVYYLIKGSTAEKGFWMGEIVSIFISYAWKKPKNQNFGVTSAGNKGNDNNFVFFSNCYRWLNSIHYECVFLCGFPVHKFVVRKPRPTLLVLHSKILLNQWLISKF